jgi:hypothetical protein
MKTETTLIRFAGILFLNLLSSCAGTTDNGKMQPAVSLYDVAAVQRFQREHPEGSREANVVFSKGVDAYRNKKHLPEARDLFIKSVTNYPTARAYYELGNVYLSSKQPDHAVTAYYLAEQLGYEPVSKVFYNMACAYSLEKKTTEASEYLEYAIEAGYANVNQIMKDADLDNLRQSYEFHRTYLTAMSGASDAAITLWQTFKRQFSRASLPVTLDMKTTVIADKSIGFDFEKFVSEMRTEKFSRDVGKAFIYYAVVEDNPHYTALIYAIQNTMMSENAPYRFMLVSFDNKGILIDKKAVGGQMEFAETFLVCTIEPSLQFDIQHYKNTYQKDPEKEGYENNPVVKSDLTETEHYRISETGKFEVLTQQLSMR